MISKLIKKIIAHFIMNFVGNVNGLENIPKKRGFMISANHASYMDHLIIGALMFLRFDVAVHYLAKKEHFDNLHQRIWHRWVGAIPIDRSGSYEGALQTAISYLKEGRVIGIYPEGTRTLTGKLQRAKTGVARLALGAKVPVVPIGIIGTFKMLPKGRYIPKPVRANVNIGRPMYFDKYYGKENNKNVLRKITTKIMEVIAKLSKQKYDFD